MTLAMDTFPDVPLDFLVADDWLQAGNASDLPDFPDADLFALGALGGKDDDDLDLQALLPERNATRSPVMRGSFSMNDLTLLQQHNTMPPAWNHKVVSVKPKLESVPEGGPSNGGPLNLMPIPSNGMAPRSGSMNMPLHLPPLSGTAQAFPSNGLPYPGNPQPFLASAQPYPASAQPFPSSTAPYPNSVQPHAQYMQPEGSGDYVDLDSKGSGSLHGSLPSTGTLAAQLQMTRVRSESQLTAMDTAPVAGSTAAAVEAFRNSSSMTVSCIASAPNMGGGPFQVPSVPNLMTDMPPPQQQHHSQQAAVAQAQQGQATVAQAGHCAPSGMPLRKSQSAVELGSWRSFSAADELWDVNLPADAKAAKLTVDERLAKIQRYKEKRLQRNFNRSVKYHCRKSLADARPRVRGRFARADDPPGAAGPGGKAQRVGSGGSDSQECSGNTSSGGPGGMQDGQGMQGGQCATSQPQAHPHTQPHPGYHRGMGMGMCMLAAQPQASMQQQSMMPPPPGPVPNGISVIGASSVPNAHPPPGFGMAQQPSRGLMPSMEQWGACMLPTSYPPGGPNGLGPSVGGIFTGRSLGASPDMAPSAAPMMYSHMPPPGMPSIFSGQTIFSGASLGLCCAGVQQGSGSGSVQPSLSPPPMATSPSLTNTSEAHSGSRSLGHSPELSM